MNTLHLLCARFHVLPHFFTRKRKKRRQQPHQRRVQPIERRLRTAARDRVRSGSIEPIFRDIEINRAEIGGREIVNSPIDLMERILLVELEASGDEIFGACQNPSIDTKQIACPLRLH